MRNIVCSFLGVLFVLTTHCVSGQESNSPVEMAKYYPPSMFNSVDALNAVRWQLKQLTPLKLQYENSKADIGQKIAELDKMIADLQVTVRPELQFLDRQDRSKLVTRAMEQMLDANLELAALESSVSALTEGMESSGGKISDLKQKDHDLQIEIAQQRVVLAQKEFQQNQKLKSRGSVTEQQLWRSKTSYEIAAIELQAAQTKAAIEKEKSKAEFADEISNKRVQIKPIQAKISTLTEFLNGIAKSNEALAKSTRLKEHQQMWKKDLALVAEQLFELNRKEMELRSLEKLIEDNLPANEEPKKGDADSQNGS